MENFSLPEVSEIASSLDIASLSEMEKQVKSYGASLATAPRDNVEALKQTKTVLLAIQKRMADVNELIAKEFAKSKEADELAAEFTVADEVEVTAPVVDEVVSETVADTFEVTKEISVPKSAKSDVTGKLQAPAFSIPAVESSIIAKYGSEITTMQALGHALSDAWGSLGQAGGSQDRSKVKLFAMSPKFNLGVEWGNDATKNMESFNSKVLPSAVAAADPEMEDSLVASGGFCAPLNIDYNIPFYAEACPTFEDLLPVVQAPRGGIRYMRPPANSSLTEAAAGIAVITAAEDAAGYTCEVPAGPTPCKPYTTIPCPTEDSCTLDMISQAVRFGNLNYRTFPEYVDYAMKAMAVAFNRAKQQYLLNKIDDPANSLPVFSDVQDYGFSYNLLADLLILKARFNAENNVCYGSTVLNVALPAWSIDLVKLDMVAREGGIVEYGGISEADVRSWFRSNGFNLNFYEGSATGAGQVMAVQATGRINAFPDKLVAYVWPSDAFVILKDGVLDLGLIRDTTLIHANNLEFFMEEFIGFCRTGRKGYRLEVRNMCNNGSFSRGVDALACTAGDGVRHG